MRICKIDKNNPDKKIIALAVKVIKNGGVIIYPTDTIYGLGANALDKNAVRRIYEIKERPETKPLSIAVKDIEMAKKYCAIGGLQSEIFKAVFPGSFTLVFKARSIKKKSELADCYDALEHHSTDKNNKSIFTIYKNTLSVRIPDSKITELLSRKLRAPFTATSANISGFPGSGDIKKVLKQMINKKDQIDLVLDAGVLLKKDPSVIVDLTGKRPKIIRK